MSHSPNRDKVVELINAPSNEIIELLEEMNPTEFQKMLRLALKEQDRNTRHACAERMPNSFTHGLCFNTGSATADLG